MGHMPHPLAFDPRPKQPRELAEPSLLTRSVRARGGRGRARGSARARGTLPTLRQTLQTSPAFCFTVSVLCDRLINL